MPGEEAEKRNVSFLPRNPKGPFTEGDWEGNRRDSESNLRFVSDRRDGVSPVNKEVKT